MKVILLGLLLSLTLAFSTHTTLPNYLPKPTTDSVYICVSARAYAYHRDKYCSGLQRCTHTIKYVSQTDAETKYKRKKCRTCYY